MKKLILLSFLVSIVFTGCKDDCDCNVCGFHQPGHPVEPQTSMLCADSCFFSFEVFGKQYTYSGEELYSSELINCHQNDECSNVLEIIKVDESFKFSIQRFEDSVLFIQNFDKKLPIHLYNSLLWGEQEQTASFELIDQCNNSHEITNYGFPETNYVIYNSAEYIGEQINSKVRIYFYTLKGSFKAKISIEQYTNSIEGVYDVNGQFSVPGKLVLFNE
jgi:hypothetical protein